MTPDPERLGGIGWVRRTGGALTAGERRRLTGVIAKQFALFAAGRARLLTGRVPAGARGLALTDFTPPDSAFARAAEEACAEQSRALVGHSYRTWAYGSALAALDGHPIEPESFYVASLLHDHGLDAPVAGEDFVVRSALRAHRCGERAGAPFAQAEAIADAMAVHALPGATVARDGALGVYVGAGAVLDLIGQRAGDLPRALRADARRAYGAPDRAAVARLVGAEARLNPEGRFALLRRCGFTAVMRASALAVR